MAGGTQVLRVEVRDRVDGPLAAHVLGRRRPPTAVASRENTVLVDQVSAAAEYAAGFPRTGPKGGRPAKPGVEFVVAGPPPYGPGEWSREQEDAYFSMALAWIVACAEPHSMISAAAIHRDETSPHLHLLMVPVGERNGVRRLGWSFIRDRFCPGPGPAAKRMSRMQDFFHAEVGRPCGLARGEKGSTATHEQIDRAQAAEAREGAADERVSQLRTSAQAALDAWGEAKAQREREEEAQREREEEALAEARAERKRQDSAAAQARAKREQDEAAVDTLRREIEAGRRGWRGRRAAAGQALIRERDEAYRERDKIKTKANAAVKAAHRDRDAAIQSAEADRAAAAETGAWRTSMRMPHQGAVPTFTPDKVRELVHRSLESARAEGVRMLWEELRGKAEEHGAECLATLVDLASLVGALFGVRGPAAPSKPPLQRARESDTGID